MNVAYTPHFRRMFKKLSESLQEEALDKIALLKEGDLAALRIHTLHGRFAEQWSFSVNYRYRIVFVWERRNESAVLIAIGDHTLYE